MTRSPSVALLGEQAPPRVLYAPKSRANSWEDVVDLSASFGLVLDPWQETILKAAMGERAGGKWAAHQVGVSAPRQNGKSQLIVARAIAGALLFDERLIVISAHQADTARETFGKFLELIEANPSLEARLYGGSIRTGVMNAINREHIKFANGATIKFKARTGAGGRGFSSDCLFLDEAQRLSGQSWVSINSTMSAMQNPQVWLLGTPPTPDDDGEVFGRIRDSALEKKAQSLAWLEWAAEPDDDPALEETRAKANPAWYTRINHEVVQGEYDTYSKEEFALDRLGIWASENLASIISAKEWSSCQDHDPEEGSVSYGVKFSADGRRVALAAAVRPDSGPVFVEIVDTDSSPFDLAGLADWLAARWKTCSTIVIDGRSHAGALVEALMERRVRSHRIKSIAASDAITAHASFVDAVRGERVSHAGQPGLASSIACAGRRDIGQLGGWGFAPVTADGDVTPAEAVVLAHHGAMTTRRRSSGGGRTGVTL